MTTMSLPMLASTVISMCVGFLVAIAMEKI